MVGKKIRTYLDENGIKHSFLSEKTEIPGYTIRDMLSGKRKIDCIEYFNICNVLNVPYDKFLKEEEDAAEICS